jgi:hypothetical protein
MRSSVADGRHTIAAIVAASMALLPVAPVAAATWDGGGADAYWTTSGNWVGDTAPVPPEALTFDGSAGLTNLNDFPALTQFGGISFPSSASNSFFLGGNPIALAGPVANLSTNNQTLALDLDPKQAAIRTMATL